MSSIDERVVSMKFQNTQFQSGVKSTLTSLDSLKKSLDTVGQAKGLTGINDAAKKVSLDAIAQSVDALNQKFTTLGIAGIAAITNIANKAVDAGLQMAKSLTLDPIGAGFSEYELKMGSIQTILSNTARYGTQLPEVTKNLDELNKYADKTIYNFGDMTKNIGLFTNAGIRVGDATTMIKGFSNEAAASGTSAQGAASAAYQLSQALSAGKITLMDWRSLQNVGMGNKNMQKGILDIADAMGTLEDKGVTAKEVQTDFNGSLQKGWLSADVMSNYLKIMAGDMTDAEMKTLGLSKATIDTFKIQQKNAEEAATKVRTWTQLIGTLREGVGSSWSETFDIVLGDFTEATELFTGISDTLGGMISAAGAARNELLQSWKDQGGRALLIDGFKNIFNALMGVVTPIKEAFREIFPAKTGADLMSLTRMFVAFTEKLKMGAATSEGFKSTLKGVFAIFSIAGKIIGGVVKFVATFLTLLSSGTGSVWSLTGSIGDLIVKFNDWLEKGKYIETFFENMAKWRAAVIKPLIDFVGRLVHAIGTLVSGDFNGFIDELVSSLTAFIPLGDAVEAKFTKIATALKAVFDLVVKGDFTAGFRKSFGIDEDDEIVGKILAIRDAIRGLPEFFNGLFGKDTGAKNAASGIDALNVSLVKARGLGENVRTWWKEMAREFEVFKEWLGQLGSSMKPMFDNIKKKFTDYFGDMGLQEGLALVNTGFFMAFYAMMRKFFKNMNELVTSLTGTFDNIGGMFDQLTNNLKTMQTSVRADIILKIAVALLALAAALWILSKIDTAKLAVSLGAVAVMLAMMIGAVAVLQKILTTSEGDIKKGAFQMTILATALLILALALLAMAAAVAIFGNMEMETLMKGLGSVAIVIGLVVGATKLLQMTGGDKELMKAATGLLILAVALMALAAAIKLFSAMDPQTLLEGGWKIAAILTVFVLMLKAMPPEGKMLQAAGAIMIISISMLILYAALKLFGSMDGGEMAKGLIMMAGALVILVAALNLASNNLKGAFALMVIAAALAILVPQLMLLGSMDWESMAKSLVFLTGLFALLLLLGATGAAGVVVLMALAKAVALLGLAALLAGAGIMLFSMGLASLAISGAAGTAALVATIIAVAQTIPLIAQQIGLGILAIAKVIADSGPVIVAALFVVIQSLLQAIIDSLPKIAELITRLVDTILRVLVNAIPKIVTAGLQLLKGLLTGISKNLPDIIRLATDIIVKFIKGIGDGATKVVKAGIETLVKFIEGVAQAVRSNSDRLNTAGLDLAKAIVQGLVNGIGKGLRAVKDAAVNLAKNALNGALSFLGVKSPSRKFKWVGEMSGLGLALGLKSMSGAVGKASESVGHEAINSMRKSIGGITDLIDGDMDMTPVITPVLDLSDIRKDASKIDQMLSTRSIATDRAYAVASENSRLNRAAQEVQNGSEVAEVGPNLTFIQNNTSPKALSSAEIYRQTKNQLSVAKGAL